MIKFFLNYSFILTPQKNYSFILSSFVLPNYRASHQLPPLFQQIEDNDIIIIPTRVSANSELRLLLGSHLSSSDSFLECQLPSSNLKSSLAKVNHICKQKMRHTHLLVFHFYLIIITYNCWILWETAAVAWGAGQPLVVEEVEVNPPQPEEIRIKVVCTSLCRSDITAWETQVLTLAFWAFAFSVDWNQFCICLLGAWKLKKQIQMGCFVVKNYWASIEYAS